MKLVDFTTLKFAIETTGCRRDETQWFWHRLRLPVLCMQGFGSILPLLPFKFRPDFFIKLRLIHDCLLYSK